MEDFISIIYKKTEEFLYSGKYEEGIKFLESEIKKTNEKEFLTSLLWYKTRFLKELKRYNEMIELFDKIIEMKPDLHTAYNNKALTLECLGKPEEALECINKSLELKPDDSFAMLNKGVILNVLKRYKESFDCYKKGLKIYPEDFKMWNNLGETLYEMGKYEDAIECYDKSLEIEYRITVFSNKIKAQRKIYFLRAKSNA